VQLTGCPSMPSDSTSANVLDVGVAWVSAEVIAAPSIPIVSFPS